MKNDKALRQVIKEVKALDSNLKEEDETFKVAVIVMSSCIVGPNIQRLSKFTKYPRHYIAPLAKRLRKNGVWVKGKIRCEWFEEEAGGIAFWLDVGVAQGLIERREK